MTHARSKSKLKEAAYTIGFMLALTIVFVSLLTWIHLSTRETVKAKESLMLRRAVLFAAGIQQSEEIPEDEVESLYKKRVEPVRDSEGVVKYYKILSPGTGDIEGYVFEHSGAGLWGAIVAVVGLDKDLKKITGIDFIKDNETPGLGARINETWFQDQFRGKVGPLDFIPEKTDTSDREFQAITGATITTTGVKNLVNRTISQAPEIVKEVK
ncbi:MAG: FMN-binding protein [Vulcanimicrobiota bacterium]